MKRLNNSGHTVILDVLSTQELERILKLELRKDPVNEILVYEILCILKEREFPQDKTTPEVPNTEEETQRRKPPVRQQLTRIVALVAIFCVLITAVPAAMGAENIVELVGRWTKDIFTMIWSDRPSDLDSEYVFRADHPGLQQIYAAVVEAGITQKVVPMWVPEECKLEELKTVTTAEGVKIRAVLSSSKQRILIVIEPYKNEPTDSYLKDDVDAIMRDTGGVKHYMVPNDGTWTIVWTAEEISCLIVTTYDQETIYRILGSIYTEGA